MAEPVARQGIRAPVPGRSPDPGVSGSGFAPRGHIVLVDDDQALRSLLVIRLMRAGYEVRAAAEGSEALRLCHEEMPDALITDLIMPGKEGIETILELRRRSPRLPIIAMSGGGRLSPEGYLSVARACGVSEALAKPFSSQELLDALTRVLAASPREHEPPSAPCHPGPDPCCG